VREVGWQTSVFVLKTILDLGTEEQKHEIVGGAMRGEIVIALGYSEPDSARTWRRRAPAPCARARSG